MGALQRLDLHIVKAGFLHPASAAHTGVVEAGWDCRSPFAKRSGIDEGELITHVLVARLFIMQPCISWPCRARTVRRRG
jgi:hypothetical protein